MMGPIVAVVAVALVLGVSLQRSKGRAIGPERPPPPARETSPT
jgi:hypothetical protein